MNEHIKQENDALREMFQTQGWQVLMRNTKAHLDAFREGFPFNVNTVEQLYFLRGMSAALQVLMTMEQQLEAAESAEKQADEPLELEAE